MMVWQHIGLANDGDGAGHLPLLCQGRKGRGLLFSQTHI